VSNQRVCDSHFDPSSFKTNQNNAKFNLTTKISKRLKRDAVPVHSIATAQSTHSTRSVSTQTDLDMNYLSNLFEKLSLYEQKLLNTTICIERFRDDDTNIKYYTDFKSYKLFCLIFELLQTHYDNHFIMYSMRNECGTLHSTSPDTCLITKENQFFLFMIRLRQATEEHELGIFFNVSQSTVSRIIIAWTRFIYSVLSSISLWPSKKQVQQNLPFEMKKNYPTVRVIVDCTELEIEKPSNPQAQQDTWSTYKNTNTVKALVGITPNGIVSYISSLYGGTTSDGSLLNMTGPGSLSWPSAMI
ncbi:unnamed protein product, partial [Rotaria magnacalcarata]